jgi:hypothetical protein
MRNDVGHGPCKALSGQGIHDHIRTKAFLEKADLALSHRTVGIDRIQVH